MKPLMIAHRGDRINFPENTIEAFASAFEKGADGVEMDLQFARGNLVIVHDYMFDERKKYPFLSEALDLFAKRGRLEIEIKSMDLDFLPSFKKLLSQYGKANVEITTSVYPLVKYLRQEFPKVSIGIIYNEKEFEWWMDGKFINNKIVKYTKLYQANVAHVPWKAASREMADQCHKNNLKLHSHILKQSLSKQIRTYREMREAGIDQCTFDDIFVLQAIKRSTQYPNGRLSYNT
ncbi:glycerophosphodiester phosphodiesterase [Candidatus Roizmanbacteria bacterium]|jgi:glycerophosphoryl diester phosphodiesterase|nr:glycerophosphodiester phosphodiesterase [Candidatus Roizmanbacteria bacterium]